MFKDRLLSDIAKIQLLNYTIEAVVSNKLSSRNFKKGLGFSNHYECIESSKTLFTLLCKKIHSELPYLTNSLSPLDLDDTRRTLFISSGSRQSGYSLTIRTLPQESIRRYIRIINKELREKVSPHLCVDISSKGYAYILRLLCNGNALFRNYLLLAYLPQILQVLKTLSRKATFQDESLRSINSNR